VRVGVLGPLEVRDAAGRVRPVGGARLRSLLIRLAISQGRAVAVDTLAADLWPGTGPAGAANAIQALVSRLRAAAGKDIVEHGPTGYRLTIAPAEVDAWAFEDLAAAARCALASGDHATAAGMLRQALAMWRGPALADVADAPFATATITRLSELRLAAAEDRIDAELALGTGAGLVPEIEQLSAEHPLRERLRGQLMRALYAAGRQADALRVFEETREVLATELGIDPSPALAAVHLAILRGELPASPAVPPGPATTASPAGPAGPAGATAPVSGPASAGATASPGTATPASPDRPTPGRGPVSGNGAAAGGRRGNLPAQLTSFVGRDDELDLVSELLAGARLITLTGPGGAGKTRLSVEAGGLLTEQAPDGVWFVPLAPVRDAIDVPQAVLAALAGHENMWVTDPVEAARLAAMEPLDRLSDILGARDLVLILDNCEHVLDAVAALAGQILAAAPGVRILATSREPLGLTGERLCPVPSLPLPPAGAGPEEAAASQAVRLFADRAGAVRPGFVVDAETADPITRICRALDGIPLAIELAAARVRALTVTQVADRLDDRFGLLSTGTRGALPRHQTLRSIVDWSWDLLGDTERTVLRRLSVFSGGATPESAEQVCALGGDPRPVVDVIASLVDKSLVVAAGQRQVRYGLLETVRAYAAERLAEAGEADQAAGAHTEYFLTLAERAEPQLRSRDQLVWLDRMTAEHDNLTAALRHAIATRDVRRALRFVRALTWYWVMRDYDVEAVEWASEVLRLAGDGPPDDLADAYVICQLVTTISKAGSDAHADPNMWDALRELSPPADSAHPLLAVAAPVLAIFGGDGEGALKALRAAPPHPDPWVRAARQALAGHLAIHDADIEAASSQLAESNAMFREVGDRFGMVVTLMGLAEVAVARDDPATAVRLLEEARGFTSGGLANNWSEMIRIPLGRARALAGDSDGARSDLEQGLRRAEQIGEFDDAVAGYLELSDMARRDGDMAKAHELLDRALATVEPRELRPDMIGVAAKTFSKLGCVAELDGDLAAAARWHERALAVLARPTVAVLPIHPTLAAVVEGIAALAAARGDHTRAAELLGLAFRLQGFSNAASLEVSRARAAAEAALTGAEFQAAYDHGRTLGRADALALIP